MYVIVAFACWTIFDRLIWASGKISAYMFKKHVKKKSQHWSYRLKPVMIHHFDDLWWQVGDSIWWYKMKKKKKSKFYGAWGLGRGAGRIGVLGWATKAMHVSRLQCIQCLMYFLCPDFCLRTDQLLQMSLKNNSSVIMFNNNFNPTLGAE